MPNAIAFAEFAWDYVSIPDRAELEDHGMFDCNVEYPRSHYL